MFWRKSVKCYYVHHADRMVRLSPDKDEAERLWHQLMIKVGSDEGLLQIFGRAPFHVPEGARPMVAESICRANHRMKVGKFEIDHSDGEVLFQTYHIIDRNLSEEVLERMMATTIAMLDRYSPALLSVIYANRRSPDLSLTHARADLPAAASCTPPTAKRATRVPTALRCRRVFTDRRYSTGDPPACDASSSPLSGSRVLVCESAILTAPMSRFH
jgi:hypothetical protein